MIDASLPLGISGQCKLLSLNRSCIYYQAKGENQLNLKLIPLMDAQYLETPYYGSPQMARYLRREGYCVG